MCVPDIKNLGLHCQTFYALLAQHWYNGACLKYVIPLGKLAW